MNPPEKQLPGSPARSCAHPCVPLRSNVQHSSFGLQHCVPHSCCVGQTHLGAPPPFTQFSPPEQHSFPHLVWPEGQGAAKATPGIEASTPPRRALPNNRNARPREMVPPASPFASSSKEYSLISAL